MKHKWFLYLTGFFSGMSVMAIELGAQRMLAPYFSSSQIVWTIVIGVIMIAMALGNVLGGRMADKHRDPKRLFYWLFAAAVWSALIPLFGKFVIGAVAIGLAMVITKNYLIWAALCSCILIYVFPLLILGMVTPNLVKFALNGDGDSGKTVGIIEALNTIGSIIGTFLPTFVTIPNIGTALTFLIFAGILLAISLIYFIFIREKSDKKDEKKGKTVTRIVAMVLLTGIALGGGIYSKNISNAFWQDNVLYEDESIYNYLRVEDTPSSVILSTNVLFGVQSIKMKSGGLTGMYYDYALASPVLAGGETKPLKVLVLGMGTGTFITQCQRYFEGCEYVGVEIDQKIIDVAYKYFDLSDEVDVRCDDGRAYLSASDEKYDVIMVDAYQDITIPFQMSSVEFFTLVRDHLAPDGNMIVNMNMFTSNEGGINDWLCGTIRSVFPSVYTVKTGTNRELFASCDYDIAQRLEAAMDEIDEADLKNLMSKVLSRIEKTDESDYILTDDKAPVELLGISAIDAMIMDEIDYYKEIIKGKSLKELITAFKNGELF